MSLTERTPLNGGSAGANASDGQAAAASGFTDGTVSYRWVKIAAGLVGALALAGALVGRSDASERVDLRAFNSRQKSSAKGANGRFEAPAGHGKDCMSDSFTKETLRLVKETNFVAAMLKYEEGEVDSAALLEKFEASDIMASEQGEEFYVVFDNSFKIGRLDRVWGSKSKSLATNKLLEWPGNAESDSQFEAIAYNTSSLTYLVVEETHPNAKVPRALVHEIKIDGDEISLVRDCSVAFEFSSANKGVEGASVFSAGDRSLLLALCEGNFCKGGKKGRQVGNGRILVLEQSIDGKKCTYDVIQTLEIPSSVEFMDYSSLALYENKRIAITSQENSAVWVSEIKASKSGDLELAKGKVYDFPRNDLCEIKYCNIEGVYFESEDVLVAVSDAMKSHGRQPFICRDKGQSVHVFSIP
mmetsp:Transcript_21805/g.38547  ORF Transcript_21805/g.38547 Transcript_21805/m.38547 type:complete len:415 (+) Transcript_21805:108-1352(+)